MQFVRAGFQLTPRRILASHDHLKYIPRPPLLRNTRLYSSTRSTFRENNWRPAYIGAVCFGTGCIAYGIFQFYISWRDLYPPEVRDDLRQGLLAKHKGDLELSERYLRSTKRAWETVQTLPVETLKGDPYRKITGIPIELAGNLIEDNRPQEAYELFSQALVFLQDVPQNQLSAQDRLTAVRIATKLGDLVPICQKPMEEQEKHWTYAVTEGFKIAKEYQKHEGSLNLASIDPPVWFQKTDIAGPLERLSSFYLKVGNIDYAMVLVNQAIRLLLTSVGSWESTQEDKCLAASLMISMSGALLHHASDDRDKQEQAEGWAQNSLSIVNQARKQSSKRIEACYDVLPQVLFALGTFRKLAGDEDRAKSYFSMMRRHCDEVGEKAYAALADDELAAIYKRAQGANPVAENVSMTDTKS